jgi:hypothetical protein
LRARYNRAQFGLGLNPGTRLGGFEIVALIGSGGMGEVYRARDSRLNRDVAIKVLPAAVAADPDRLARFEREAQVLASLNHPNIAQIHGVDDSSGAPALVMELVEGPTLADRIAKGPIPLDEALPIAKQIAEALEAAHEQGIIHRDLKPANVKVRADGTVKLLDFGLAKAFDPVASAAGNATMSPTLSMHATQAGIIFGTAAYMSPEQVRGGTVDKQSDIWAFGCVLFEMLAGNRLFGGQTISDTLACVLREPIDVLKLPGDTPTAIRWLLRRCLERDPKRRLRNIGDAHLMFDGWSDVTLSVPASAAQRRTVVLFVGAALVAVLATGAAAWALAHMPSRISSSYRFAIQIPAEMPLLPAAGSGIAISPDGRTFVYVSPRGLVKHLLDSFEFEVIRGTEGARSPFFSPDSHWLGFWGDNKIRKIPMAGGVPTEVCDVAGAATWGDDETIIVAQGGKLYRVPSMGGKPEEIRVQGAPVSWGDPVFLPGSAAVLAVAVEGPAVGPSHIEAIRLATGERFTLAEGTSPRFGAPDQLLFEQRGNLWTANFDVKHLALRRPALPVVEGVRLMMGATALVSVSTSTIAFAPAAASNEASLVWLDRTGQPSPALTTTAAYSTPRLSPDGRRVAVSVQSPTSLDVWVFDLERGTRLRLTTVGSNRRPVWSPDGSRIAFQSGLSAASAGHIYIRRANGGGEAERLNDRPLPQFPDSWTPDGRALLFNEGAGRRDILIQSLDGEAKPLVKTVFSQRSAMIAPNGRWFSFVSNESGHDEVYVQPLAGGAKIVVSTSGGRQPAWSHSGRELFYREDDWLMSVDMSTPEHPGRPTRQFEFSRRNYGTDPNVVEYDIGPDRRILAVHQDSSGSDDIRVIVNWHR